MLTLLFTLSPLVDHNGAVTEDYKPRAAFFYGLGVLR
jgi:hypothetical protein